ncbi:MAG: FMN-binding glutamate synthase family protein [Firmicutes bacterium]|nr:FMN-binding glutamate synthase family protein [Bacillota bacterium]
MRNRRKRNRSHSSQWELIHWLDRAGYFAARTALTGAGLLLAGRQVLGHLVRRATKILMTDDYAENLLELYSAVRRTGLQNVGETNLRASSGQVIQRPLGSPKKMPDFSNLMFDAAQLAALPTQLTTPVALQTVIGPNAAKPLQLEIPITISGMTYGWALTEAAKLALALGATGAGTAVNTGQGPWLESSRRAARKLIYQYDRINLTKNPDHLRRSDAIEIQLGQGAAAGAGMVLPPQLVDACLQREYGIGKGEAVVSHARQPRMRRPQDLAALVDDLREKGDGIPIGVKMCPSQHLEQDLRLAVEAGVDFITLDGASAATKGSAPILQDDFGLPTLFALVRASDWLKKQNLKGEVTLIISGGLKTPGDYLKALALGADVVAIGSIALFAITHTQVTHAIPFEPPTQAAWYGGKGAHLFDAEAGGESLKNYLLAAAEEMAQGIRALGLTSLRELDKRHLFALDRTTAEICGVPLGWEPQE